MTEQHTLIESITGLVIFEIANREFCADIKDVSAIINPIELKQARSVESQYIEINNNDIPVIPLHAYFGLELRKKSDDNRVLIIEPNDIFFSFFVERVKEIFTMSREFKNKISFTSVKEGEYLSGIINYEGRTFYLPDFEKIVTDKK